MPATTKRQQRFMGACSNPIVRSQMNKKCPPMAVAKEFAKKPVKKKKNK